MLHGKLQVLSRTLMSTRASGSSNAFYERVLLITFFFCLASISHIVIDNYIFLPHFFNISDKIYELKLAALNISTEEK